MLKARIQKHRGKPLLFHDKCPGFFYEYTQIYLCLKTRYHSLKSAKKKFSDTAKAQRRGRLVHPVLWRGLLEEIADTMWSPNDNRLSWKQWRNKHISGGKTTRWGTTSPQHCIGTGTGTGTCTRIWCKLNTSYWVLFCWTFLGISHLICTCFIHLQTITANWVSSLYITNMYMNTDVCAFYRDLILF